MTRKWNMKKLIIAFFLIAISLSATAQYADKDIILKRGKLYCDGIQLTHQQSLDYFSNVTGEDRTQDYLQYTRDFKIGKQMEIWGAVAFGVGAVTEYVGLLTIFTASDETTFRIIQGSMMAGGVVCIGGIVTSICGTSKKRKAGRNLSNLTVGAQENGVGIALNF
jgi:hypothetical protein